MRAPNQFVLWSPSKQAWVSPRGMWQEPDRIGWISSFLLAGVFAAGELGPVVGQCPLDTEPTIFADAVQLQLGADVLQGTPTVLRAIVDDYAAHEALRAVVDAYLDAKGSLASWTRTPPSRPTSEG